MKLFIVSEKERVEKKAGRCAVEILTGEGRVDVNSLCSFTLSKIRRSSHAKLGKIK